MKDHYDLLLRQVNRATHDQDLTEEDLREGARSVLELLSDRELLDPPGATPGRREAWVRGYEQCMVDIVEALADEWGVTTITYPEVIGDHDGGRER